MFNTFFCRCKTGLEFVFEMVAVLVVARSVNTLIGANDIGFCKFIICTFGDGFSVSITAQGIFHTIAAGFIFATEFTGLRIIFVVGIARFELVVVAFLITGGFTAFAFVIYASAITCRRNPGGFAVCIQFA